MKHLRCTTTVLLAGLAVPLAAQAEMVPLDDAGMRATTGQAGVTIDLSANVDIAEAAYEDQGYIFINNVKLGGAGIAQSALGQTVTDGTALDNLRMTIDVAGQNQDDLGSVWGLEKLNGTSLNLIADSGDHGVTPIDIEDGDLVISLDAQDHAEGVDFGLTIDDIRLGQSGLAPGEGTKGGATIISGLKLEGLLGPTDIVVDEAENRLNINAFFSLQGEITMDWYIPILLDYKGMSMDLALHNRRGDDVLIYEAPNGDIHSYAHLQADIGATDHDTLEINITDFSADMDWIDMGFGDMSQPIGNVYWTDLQVQASLDIYGH